MKALAAEKLRDQIKSLKGSYRKMKLNIPTIIISTECYINILDTVKSWTNSGRCTVVVPSCLLNDIDYIKKFETSKVNVLNEVSRYLESITRRKSEYVRFQKPGEKTVIWDHNGKVKDSNVVVPKSLRNLMAVSLYYKRIISFMAGDEMRNIFAIVSDSPLVLETAAELEIRTYGSNEWTHFLNKIQKSPTKKPNTPYLAGPNTKN